MFRKSKFNLSRRKFLGFLGIGTTYFLFKEVLDFINLNEDDFHVFIKSREIRTIGDECLNLERLVLKDEIFDFIKYKKLKEVSKESIYAVAKSHYRQILYSICFYLIYKEKIFEKTYSFEEDFIKKFVKAVNGLIKEHGVEYKEGDCFTIANLNYMYDCNLYVILYLSIFQVLEKEIKSVINYNGDILDKLFFSFMPGHLFIKYQLNSKAILNIETTSGGILSEKHYITLIQKKEPRNLNLNQLIQKGVYLSLIPSKKFKFYLYFNLGVILYEIKNYRASCDVFSQAEVIYPNFYLLYGYWADALKHFSEYEKAETKYRKAININPYNFELYRSLGVVLFSMKKLDEAYETLKIALRLNPNDYFIYYNIADVSEAMGKKEESEKYLAIARSLN